MRRPLFLFAALMATLAIPVPAAQPTEIASRYFRTSDGVRLHLLETPPAPGKTIVLIPGWSMPASIWQRQLPALARHHRVIAFDPRGQGRSEVAASGYDIDRRADDLHELLEQHVRGPVVLVGWSLGALETLQYLHRHGEEKTLALVLVDSSIGEGPASAGPSRFPEELRRNRRKAVNDFVQAIFKTPRPAREIRALTEGALRMPLEASLSLFPGHLPREHWRALARGYARPLLYVATPQFAEQARELAAHRPGTRTEVFARAGHALFVDEPARFNRLLEDFLART